MLFVDSSFQILYQPSPPLVRNDMKFSALSPEAKNLLGTNLKVRSRRLKAKRIAGIVKIRIGRGE